MKYPTFLALFAITANVCLTPFTWAREASQAASGSVSGFVTPSDVREKEPFTFAASGSVEGEVVEIKTVEGEVVATKKTDPLGRVFLATGLAAGTYLLTRGGGGGGAKPSTPIEIAPGNPPSNPGGPLNLPNPDPLCNLKDGLKLSGTGINPNAALMEIQNGATHLPVLAATAREIKTGPIDQLEPGSYNFQVKNLETGDSAKCSGLTLFAAQSRLTRTKVTNGELTQLEFAIQPENVGGQIKARITSGPVHFSGGGLEQTVELNGAPKAIPILANATGMGRFTVAWELTNVALLPPNPDQEAKKKPCPAEEHQRDPGAWQRSVEGKKFVAWRKMVCNIYFKCSKPLGHAGDHDFTEHKRCTKREKFADADGNGVWDDNDGGWTDKNGDGKVDAGEYTDKNGDGKYNPPEKFDDANKNGSYDGDRSEKHYFDTKEDRDKYIKDNGG